MANFVSSQSLSEIRNWYVNTSVILTLLFILLGSDLSAHGTQVAYCVTTDGRIRVYIEHWHGNISPPQVVNAPVTIDVLDTSTGLTSTFMSLPDGVVWDTSLGDLPDCKGPLNVVSFCPGRANVYNDWVYWDFIPPSCFVNLQITVVEVTGSQSFYFDEPCAELYPVTFADSFIDCVPPTVECPDDFSMEVNTPDCEAVINSEIEPTILFDDCTAIVDLIVTYDITGALVASGNGTAVGLTFPKGTSTITYSVTDEQDKTSTCSFDVTVEDNTSPVISCPANIDLECGDQMNGSIISDWLNQATASDNCGILDITNDYDPNGFAADFDQNGNPIFNIGNLTASLIDIDDILYAMVDCKYDSEFVIEETQGHDLYDYVLQIRINAYETFNTESNFVILDNENRIVPSWVVEKNKDYVDVWVKIPELPKNSESTFSIKYGDCEGVVFREEDIFMEEISPETASLAMHKPIVSGDFISNQVWQTSVVIENTSNYSSMPAMPCNCTATQGTQTFPINAIQNAEDDVSFYAYSNPAGASSNTGLECSEAVVLFLYENTLTGEISLFILIDIAGDPTGGQGSIDFFCLPSTATLDFSDDPGEISGLFPTVTANWRWAPCCTDGALIGNVGCNTTFDFFPNFTSGINDIKWASGTLAAPVYSSFGSASEPIRISCGTAQPSCCPNSNIVNITNETCPGSEDGAINITVDPDSAPYTFIWSNGATTEDISDLSNGTYTVTVTDMNDCEQIISNEVDVQNKPTLNCPPTITLDFVSDVLDVTLDDLGVVVDYDCTSDFELTCTGCETYTCSDQNMTIVVTVTVEDELGNESSCDINVTLRNNPPMVNCPDDLNLDCGDPLFSQAIDDWLGTVSSPDEDLDSIVNDYDPNAFAVSEESPTGLFDSPSSGKQSTHSGPQDFYYRIMNATLLSGSSIGTQTVTFTATDLCGNVSRCSATITIDDSTAPIISCPDDITLECGDPNNDAIITTWINTVSGSDACSDEIRITNNYNGNFTGGCGDTGSTTITFTADDGCGNTSDCRATITLVDTTPPEFLMKPQDITVECINVNGNNAERNLWLANDGGGMAMDECDSNVTWSEVAGEIIDLCGYTFSQEYTFTITDDCGNQSTATATFTVEDTTPPTLNLRADVTQNCATSNDASLAIFLSSFGSATDVCSLRENIDVSYVLFNSVPSCGQTRQETYLFTAVDECGNITQDFFTYTTTDTTIPTWSAPPGTLIITCNDPDNPTLIAQWIEDIEESMVDGCSLPLTVTNNWDGVVNEGCATNTVITFTVTDDCGNSRTNLNRTIQVRDSEDPIFTFCPEDFTVNVDVDQCGSIVNFPTPSAFDQCTPEPDLTILQLNGPASGSTFPIGTTFIQFRVRDACNRQAFCEFNITVVDSDTPDIHCASNDVVKCVDSGSCTWMSDDSIDPIVNDNCTVNSVTYTISGATSGAGANSASGATFNAGTSTVCYEVSDGVNNAQCCFDVIVSDCDEPTLNCPDDITFSCDELTTTEGGTPETGLLIWDHNDAGGSNYNGVNNISSLVNSVNDISFGPGLQLLDNNANPATIPNGSTFEHVLTDVATNNFAGAKAADDYVEISFDVGTKSILSQIQEGIVPTAWGGSAAGSFQVAAEISNDGFATSTLLYQNAMIGDPNAVGGYVLYQEPLAFALNAGATYTIRFYLYDENNNASLANGIPLPDNTVAFDDLQITIEECLIVGGTVQLNDWLDTASASDNCSNNVTIESIEFNTISGCGNTNTTVYQFEATDAEGNSTICYASFTIEDNTAPIITEPAMDGDSNCDDANADLLDWINNFGFAEAEDDCGTVTWSYDFLGDAETNCSGVTSLSVRFTATDDCGNSEYTDASFVVEDEIAPTITCPSDITLECGDAANDAVIDLWLLSYVADDNCSEVDVTSNFDESFSPSCSRTGVYAVTFTARDQCGNRSTCEANIVVEDTTIPRFVIMPQDLHVECDGTGNSAAIAAWVAANGGAIVEDNCDSELDWNIEEAADDPQCGNSAILEYNFMIEDDCGNFASAIAFVHVEDTTAPNLVAPEDITMECDGEANADALDSWLLGASASDLCSDEFTFTSEVYNNTSACGGGEAISYIFTARDDCGNESTSIATFTIADETNPSITCPDNLIIECGAPGNDPLIAAWLISSTSTDGCSDVTLSHSYTGVLPSNCGGSVTVTFFAVDECGNTETCQANIIMQDVTIPDFVNCPQDLTINVDVDGCGSNPIYSTPIAVDNCDVTVAQTAGPASGTPFPVGDTDIEFTAEDECGNTITCNFTITVVDSDIPTLVCQPTVRDVCVDDGNCLWTSEDIGPLFGQENCPESEVAYTVTGMTNSSGTGDASGILFNIGTSTVCYTLTDASDNEASCCFDVIVIDCEMPEINCPEDITVGCDGFGNAEELSDWLETVTGSDNCEDEPELSSMLYNDISGCGATSSLVYEFKAIDNFGNESVCYGTFTIEDSTSPTIEDEASDLIVECDGVGNSNDLIAWLESFGEASASDECGTVTWSHDFTGNISDLCGTTGEIDVAFTATDQCGNSSNTVATFTIEDTTIPQITCPADITLECGDVVNDAVIENWLSTANVDDDCSNVTFVNDYNEEFETDCGTTGAFTVTFTATDACGNVNVCSANIVVEDTTNPVIGVDPMDLTVSCSAENIEDQLSNWLENNGGASAEDVCDDELVWSFEVLDPIPGCGTTMSTPYIFTVTDECGNTDSAIAEFSTEDTELPVLDLPLDITVECDGLGNDEDVLAWLNTVGGTDNCSEEVVTSSNLYNTISACGGGDTNVYLFSATDECGNQMTGLASFTIEDSTPPVITCPEDLQLECGDIANDQLILEWLSTATATDVCSQVSVDSDFPGALPEDCNGSLTITFTATDECGNTTTCTADILMDDTTDPTFVNCPEDDLVINVDVDNCSANPIFSTPIADDNCSVTVAQTQGPSSGAEFDLGTTLVEFTATDGCGNEVICQFNIVVVDSDVPMILCPSTTLQKCTDENRCNWLADSSVDPSANFENCPEASVTFEITGETRASGVGSASGQVLSLGTSTICYTIMDNSGNESTCCFDVVVQDCQEPELICPPMRIVECAASNELALNDWLLSASASDNCDANVQITFELWNSISGCGNTQAEQYLFTAIDDFGNSTTCIQSFEIQDNTAPVIVSATPNVVVECNGTGNTDQFIIWLENNGNISDDDVLEFCNNFEWNNNLESIDFIENETCADNIGYYDVQFWVVDECGNTSNRVIKRFTVEDTSDPELLVPDDITLECNDPASDAIVEAWINDVAASDICDANVEVETETIVSEQCGLTFTTVYTFIATDHCGNMVQDNATITIVDTTDPLIEIAASDLILECAGESNAEQIATWIGSNGGAVASDVCSNEELEWEFEASPTAATCGDTGTTLYIFTVTDNCGNEISTSASVIIQDSIEPMLSLPVDQLEECGDIDVTVEEWQAEATASDECGEVFIDVILWNTISDCGGTNTEQYLFTATDDCGNSTTGIANYETEDTQDPIIFCPDDLALDCGNEDNDQIIAAWLESVSAIDANDCSQVVTSYDLPGGLPNPLDCNEGEGTVVTFTATDECGNSTQCTATITMDDEDDPYFVNCPTNLTVNVDVDLCVTNVVYSIPVALDDCDENVNVALIDGPASGTAFELGTTTVTFEATDICGNTSICSFDITVIDSDIPSIDCPSNDVVVCTDEGSCNWISNEQTDPLFNDNCEGLVVTYEVTGATTATSSTEGVNKVAEDGVVFNLGTSTICYTINDPTGNTSSCCFNVVVEDCEDPTITCSDELNVACGSEDIEGWMASIAATITDNCSDVESMTVQSDLITDFSSCGNTIEQVYLFTVTDQAGNQSTCLATYETDDEINPIIESEAENLVLECDGSNQSTALQAWLNNNAGATASDVCSEPIVWTNDFRGDLSDGCGASGEITVQFTATDDCGNSSSTSATFTIEDNVPPVLTIPADITTECGDELFDAIIESWLNGAEAIDQCESSILITNDYGDQFTDGCGLTGVHTVTWTAIDACDNTTTDSATVTISDNTSPTILIEANDLILECAGENNEVLTSAWLENNGGALATDLCSDEALVWEFEAEPAIGSCGDTGSTLYVFTVTDNCGNESETTALLIIEDSTQPILNVPEDQLEECGNIEVSLEEWQAEAMATDECGEVSIAVILWNTISGCGGTSTGEYLFTATDACGNQSTGIANYQTEDTQDPVIVCPEDLALTCGIESNDQIILSWLQSVTVSDPNDCSQVELSYDYPGGLPDPLDCNGGEGVEVTFTATDECGNSSQCTATITMDDEDDPYFINCPTNLTVNVDVDLCETNVVYSTPIALDNCDEDVNVALIEGPPSGTAFELGTSTVTFEATDICGNTSICTFDITVIDSDVPSIDCPSNEVLVCTDEATCTWLSDNKTNPIFTDNCEGLVVTYAITGATESVSAEEGVNVVSEDNVVFNLGTSEVCYTITDPTNNSSTCCFNVVVEDCEDPTIACRDEFDVACGSEDIEGWMASIAATITDNCSDAESMTVESALITDFSSCGNTIEQVYLFTVTDQAGNQSTCLATYETDDEVNPVIDTEAENLVLECDGSNQSTALQAWLNDNGGASASDVCSGPIVWTNNFVGDLSDGCGASGEIEVTFTATDECDNFSSTTAVFRIEDNVPPTLTIPENIILECGDPLFDAVVENWLNGAGAIDNCESSVTVTNNFGEVFEDGCGLTGVHTITWTAIDACDNVTTDDATMTIEDNTRPDITEEAMDLVLECAAEGNEEAISTWIDNNGGAQAIDLCSDEPLVWTFETQETIGGCGDTGSTLYTFTVTDNCGNQSQSTALLIIQDTAPPVLNVPENQVEECASIQITLEEWQAEATATDECGDVDITVRLDNTISGCGDTNTEVFIFTATDACGNTTSATAEYSIEDTTDPVITQEAENFTAECNGASNAAEILNWLNNNGFAEAEDSCGDITWSNNYGEIEGDCGTTGEIEVTFWAEDECGNTSSTISVFTINDTTAPTFELLPQDLEIECDGSNDPMGQIEAWLETAGGAEVEDDCSFVIYSNDFENIDLECDQEGGVLVTFTATDACGNAISESATLTVTDDVAPEILTPAQDSIVECNGLDNEDELQSWLDNHGGATAEDGCSVSIEWNYTLMSTEDQCGFTSRSTYAFTATDACGNVSANTLADFIIEDTTAPDVSEVLDLVVECDGDGNENDIESYLSENGGAFATDICSQEFTWEFDLVTIEETCGITNIQTYRFTVFDECGNSSTGEAIFQIEDTTPPLIEGGADMNMEECDDPPLGNFPDFDFWLDSNAGATATDACNLLTWSNDYHPDNWIFTCGNTRFVDVIFTATDECGNSSEITHQFGVGDVTAPEFTNCPRPPVIVDAPEGWCSANANFELPQAVDNCGGDVEIIRTDALDLNSGDLFPVGLSILEYQATDECGNTSTCELKIIVNDFHTEPTIECPADVTVVADGDFCETSVPDLSPVAVEENCPENLSVIYEVNSANGDVVSCGVLDASNTQFPVGVNTLTYTAIDQPILLITEVIQDGVITGVEITNFGPRSLDISCLDITREGPDDETYNIPNGTVLGVGQVFTQVFSNVQSTTPAGYYILFVDRVIDGVSVNGYSSNNYNFQGTLFGEYFERQYICDHDLATDFALGDDCNPGTFGAFNEGLVAMPDNGTTVGLQQGEAGIAQCSSTVEITDRSAPFCASQDTFDFDLVIDTDLRSGCTELFFEVNANMNISDVRVEDLVMNVADASDLTVTLISPTGTEIVLFNGLCSGATGISVNLDDQANENIQNIDCSIISDDDRFGPSDPFKTFFNEDARGTWTMQIDNEGNSVAIINSAVLEVMENVPYRQTDVTVSADQNDCRTFVEWQQPFLSDNCCDGDIRMEYSTQDDIALPQEGDVELGVMEGQFFEVGTTTVIYTSFDQFGNESQCSFDVVVDDRQEPEFSDFDCQDLEFDLSGAQCEVPLSSVLPQNMEDNCGDVRMEISPDFTTGIPSGEHEITVTLIDDAGNESSCTFNVSVAEFSPSSDQMACIGELNLSLDADCQAVITADMILADASIGCADDFCVRLFDEDEELIGSSVEGTNIVYEEHIGQTITVEVCADCGLGNCCWGFLTVEHKLIPEVVCPPDIEIPCNQSFNTEITGEPVVQTCEQEIYFNFDDEFINLGVCEDPSAMINRTWFITDESGNTITCEQTITIVDFELSDIVCAADTIITNEYTCAEVIENPMLTHPDSTGYPLIFDVPISETGEGLCSHFWSWDDLVLQNCEGSYEILRTWTIHDKCEEIIPFVNPHECIQVIKVLDQEPPVFENCPDDLTINAGLIDCRADLHLNEFMPEIYDLCGTVEDVFVTVNPGIVFENPPNSGEFFLSNLVPGNHIVKIRAKDQCSNYDVCEFTINVEDLEAPNVICDQNTVVSLTSTGTAKLYGEVLDDGSFDYCTPVKFQVYRPDDYCIDESDLIPGDFVTLCCDDVANSPIMVVLRVWDDGDKNGEYGTIGDSFGECMVSVTVQDKTVPDLQCPPDITVFCGEDFTNLELTGSPATESVCNTVDAQYVDDLSELEDCDIGRVARRWTIPNDSEIVECIQFITISSPDDFSEEEIVWAPDWEGTCTDDIPDNTPQFAGSSGCNQIGVNVESDTFYLESDGCFKIINHWKVINWCTGEEFENFQTLKFTDESAPDIIVHSPSFINQENCSANVRLRVSGDDSNSSCPSESIHWNIFVDLFNDGTRDYHFSTSFGADNNSFDDSDGDGIPDLFVSATAPGEELEIELPESIELAVNQHLVTWSASDGCGNITTENTQFNIDDLLAPSAACLSLSTGVMENGELTLWACDFVTSAVDDCTDSELLMYSFTTDQVPTEDPTYDEGTRCTSITFTCEDLINSDNGLIELDVVTWDLSGNFSVCTSMVTLMDNSGVCGQNLDGMIAGRVSTPKGEMMKDVTAVLELMNPSVADFDKSDENGYFLFEDVIDGSDYRLNLHEDGNYLNGVSTLDLIAIQQHILTVDPFTSPYQMIAADANADQRITGFDVVELRKLILGVIDDLENNLSWRFVSQHEEMDMENIWPFVEEVYINDFDQSIMNNDFIGTKIGDVNFSAIANVGGRSSEQSSSNVANLNFKSKEFSEGEYVSLILENESDFEICGMQFTMNHKDLELISVNSEYIENVDSHFAKHNDKTTFSFGSPQGESLGEKFNIEFIFKANKNGNLNRSVYLTSDITKMEAYARKPMVPVELRLSSSPDGFIVVQNNPNPFVDKTEIELYLPETDRLEMNIYDSEGVLLYKNMQMAEAGWQNIKISKSMVGLKSGVLTVQFEFQDKAEIIKMISID